MGVTHDARPADGEHQAYGQRFDGEPLHPAEPLAAAIDAAQKESGGRAVRAALTSRYDATLFEVRVVKDWTTQNVLVDPATAKVVTVPPRGKHKNDDD